jgi:hypothetical protein
VSLPEQLLLSDLLRLRVRCDQGLDHGPGVLAWMHPPVHRLLGWVSRPSTFRSQRRVWRLDQLRGLSEGEAFVKGKGSDTEPGVLEQLPTLIGATLYGAGDLPLGTVADAAVQVRSGRILHYLVARSDPRLPGTSRWRLSPERIVDQQPGRVVTALEDLDDLPLARSSVRQELLRRSRRWREQVGEETTRLRDQFQQVGDRVEERLEGWLEEPPWEGFGDEPERERWSDPRDRPGETGAAAAWDPLEDWEDETGESGPVEPWERAAAGPPDHPQPRFRRSAGFAAEDSAGAGLEGSAAAGSDRDYGAGENPGPETRSRRPQARRAPRSPGGSERYRGRDDDDPWI